MISIYMCIYIAVSTGILDKMTYTGALYYKEKGSEELVIFTVAKDLSALIEASAIYGCLYILDFFAVYEQIPF